MVSGEFGDPRTKGATRPSESVGEACGCGAVAVHPWWTERANLGRASLGGQFRGSEATEDIPASGRERGEGFRLRGGKVRAETTVRAERGSYAILPPFMVS
jgi:hypothetical protein